MSDTDLPPCPYTGPLVGTVIMLPVGLACWAAATGVGALITHHPALIAAAAACTALTAATAPLAARTLSNIRTWNRTHPGAETWRYES